MADTAAPRGGRSTGQQPALQPAPASPQEPGYDRDLQGYGATPPQADWPGGARLAVQFVINYEEGGENCILHGDAGSEAFLSEIIGAESWPGERHMSMESIYEYGARVGIWRLLDVFAEFGYPATVFAVATALQRHPVVAEAALAQGHELACHGLKWINYRGVTQTEERAHMCAAISIHEQITGARPLGWYTGRTSVHTRGLVMEDGGFLYDADDYSDDLPFWFVRGGAHQLVVPYTLDANDMRFATAQGFNTSAHFYRYLVDSFDALYEEGARVPRMMSVGLHCRLAGRPGRVQALKRFCRYIRGFDDIWVCRRVDIARHWHRRHPPPVVSG